MDRKTKKKKTPLTLAGRWGGFKVMTMENSSGKRSHLKKNLDAGKLRAWGVAAWSLRPRDPCTCTTLTPSGVPCDGTASARMSRGRRSVAKRTHLG